MKNRTDNILLIAFLVSLLFYFFALPRLFYSFAEILLDNSAWMKVYDWLSMCFHAVPAFCLQLLLCRKARRWAAALPTLIFAGLALWATYSYFISTAWDTLGYAALLFLCAAPAVGCVLAWTAYGGWTLYRKKDIHHPD